MSVHCRATIGPLMFELENGVNGAECELVVLTVLEVAMRLLEMWRIIGCEISVDRLAEAIHSGQFFMMDSFLDALLATKSLEFTHRLCEAGANVKDDEVQFLDRVLGLAPRDCLNTI
jgi:hypothetical protein